MGSRARLKGAFAVERRTVMSDCIDHHKTETLGTPERNRYFYGKLLDEASLSMEQRYFNQKRWMMNRLGLGHGVLCGLHVDVQGDCVCISPGVAIDTMGHEIVVPEAVPIDPRKITDDRGVPTGEEMPEGKEGGYVCLAYRECLAEPVPVLVTDCDNPHQQAPSVIRESYCVIVKKGPAPTLPAVPDKNICEALSEKDPDAKRRKICEALSSRTCSLDDACACVVLASLTREGDKFSVTQCSARPLVYSNPELFEMLLCLSEGGGGGSQGPMGPAGLGIDLVEREDRLCTEPPTVRLEGTSPNRTLYLGIPPGCDGVQGPEGPGISKVIVNPLPCEEPPIAELDPDSQHPPHQILTLGIPGHCDQTLTKITDINWPHDGQKTWQAFLKDGLQIGFSDEVSTKPGHDQGWFLVSFELSGGQRKAPQGSVNPLIGLIYLMFTLLWPIGTALVYRVDIKKGSISWQPPAGSNPDWHAQWNGSPFELASYIAVLRIFVDDIKVLVRVVAKCDFLIDKNGKCVDGNHLRGSVSLGNATGDESGDGVSGGKFESWFELVEPGSLKIPGVSPTGLSANLRSGKLAKREKDAMEKILPGFGGLAAFFNK
jgi:hypothetical protein